MCLVLGRVRRLERAADSDIPERGGLPKRERPAPAQLPSWRAPPRLAGEQDPDEHAPSSRLFRSSSRLFQQGELRGAEGRAEYRPPNQSLGAVHGWSCCRVGSNGAVSAVVLTFSNGHDAVKTTVHDGAYSVDLAADTWEVHSDDHNICATGLRVTSSRAEL